MSQKKKITFIDLFAGVGGFHLALNGGGVCLFSSEINPDAQTTYKTNFKKTPIYGDITAIDSACIPSHNILCAGFPCQPFSIAGEQKGFDDVRGTLFFEICRIAEFHKPEVLFLENVKNLKTHNNGKTLATILKTLDKMGYSTYYDVLNASTHANIPQNRERIFLVAFNKIKVKNHKEFSFPKPIELTSTIHDFLDHNKQDDCFYYKKDSPYYAQLNKEVIKTETTYQLRRIYIRENKSNLCPTLTANMGMGGHNVPIIRDSFGIRKLTPRECFNFQGYPKTFILPKIAKTKLYVQAGNSIVYPLVKKIAKNIIKVLDE